MYIWIVERNKYLGFLLMYHKECKKRQRVITHVGDRLLNIIKNGSYSATERFLLNKLREYYLRNK